MSLLRTQLYNYFLASANANDIGTSPSLPFNLYLIASIHHNPLTNSSSVSHQGHPRLTGTSTSQSPPPYSLTDSVYPPAHRFRRAPSCTLYLRPPSCTLGSQLRSWASYAHNLPPLCTLASSPPSCNFGSPLPSCIIGSLRSPSPHLLGSVHLNSAHGLAQSPSHGFHQSLSAHNLRRAPSAHVLRRMNSPNYPC